MKNSINGIITKKKKSTYIYITIQIILFLVLLFISYIFNYYGLLFINIFFIFLVIDKVISYINIKRVEGYLKSNNLIDKIGNIYYCDANSYMMTEKYIIVIDKDISIYNYNDVIYIYEEVSYKITRHSHIDNYILLKFKNNYELKILINSDILIKFVLKKCKNATIKDKEVSINNHRL